MPKTKKRPAKRVRTKADRIWPSRPPEPSALARSFSTFTKCAGCDEGSIDVQKFPIIHKPGCAYDSQDFPNAPPARQSNIETLRQSIARALNSVSAENGSNTPDFILARFLTDCLGAFDHASKHRAEWFGTNGVTSPEFLEQRAPAPAPQEARPRPPMSFQFQPGRGPRDSQGRQTVHFAITDEQMGTFGAGWRQRLSGHAALPPNMDPRRVHELQQLVLQYKNDIDLGYAVMELNGSEGFRP